MGGGRLGENLWGRVGGEIGGAEVLGGGDLGLGGAGGELWGFTPTLVPPLGDGAPPHPLPHFPSYSPP